MSEFGDTQSPARSDGRRVEVRTLVERGQCLRCAAQGVVRVAHSERGVRVYCLDHFHRLTDVPPGSVVTWAASA